jgi:uncharacterized metal-binding protein YceD (DUF177 family)
MQLTLAQLRKVAFPYTVDEDLDLTNELNGFEDIISISLVHVHSVIRERGIDTYEISFHISCELTLEDSVSLEPISYPLDTEAVEIFTTDSDLEDAFLIDGITLNTKEAVITNILCEKPMSYTFCEFESDPEPEEKSEESDINPAFSALKDLI